MITHFGRSPASLGVAAAAHLRGAPRAAVHGGLAVPRRLRARAAPTAAAEAPSPAPSPPPPPKQRLDELKKFTPPPALLGALAASAAPMLFRAGSGTFCMGYTVELAPGPAPPGVYTAAEVAGRHVVERSAVAGYPRPAKPLVLYEHQGCPFCLKVREAVALLDLDVEVRPCPRGGKVWRPKAKAASGVSQFPYMEDPNTGAAMLESDEIIAYLFATYGPGADAIPLQLRLGALTAMTAGLALTPRLGAGSRYRPARQPAAPLELWGYCGSPFSSVATAVLGELELPYILHNCARGSPRRQAFFAQRGVFQVPFLVDPNTGAELFESDVIVAYLERTYAL